jgi:hypothetical protein
MALPSLEVKVMLSVWVAPTATDTIPPAENVATTELLVPVGPLMPPIGLPGGLPPVFPLPPVLFRVPLMLP